MSRVMVNEGSSGIVELRSVGGTELFYPDNDLDKALELLFVLYDLKASNGVRFLDNYWKDGVNWLSGQVGNLYWRYLFRYVQFEPLIKRIQDGEITPHFVNKVNLARIHEVLHPKTKYKFKERLYYRTLIPRHNADITKGGMNLLFYRYGPEDFRTRDLLGILEDKNADFHFCYSPSMKMYKARNKQPRPVYFLHRKQPCPRIFAHEYDLSTLAPDYRRIFKAIIDRVEENMSFQHLEYRRHMADLGQAKPKLFFGLDDHQEIHPVLYACRELGIPSIGYQFSMYARRQAAYTLERWPAGTYQGFDKVITWGRYWQDTVRKWSDAHSDDYFLLGTNKHNYGYKRLESDRFDVKNILVPYEFWGNTRLIGQYMMRLMDQGYTVYFKFKPDERPERQIECYRLPAEYADRLVHVFDITDELMAEVNIVAGGMTTLLYDLLPYGKHTWVFDTEFRLLDDMVQDGLAMKIRLDELENMPIPDKADRAMDYTYIFNDAPLSEVMERYVLSQL